MPSYNGTLAAADNDYDRGRRELYWALRTRVLTDEEMARVADWDYQLCVESMVPYNENDKRREFLDALLHQFKLRAVARGVAVDPDKKA